MCRSRSARACAACARRVRRVALHLLIKMTEFLNFRHFSSFVVNTFYRFKTVPLGVKCIFEIAYNHICCEPSRSKTTC